MVSVRWCLVYFLVALISAESQLPQSKQSLEPQLGKRSWLTSINQLKEKTAALNSKIEQTASPGKLGNLVVPVIQKTTGILVNAITTVDKAINDAKEAARYWAKNVTGSSIKAVVKKVVDKVQDYVIANKLENVTLPEFRKNIAGFDFSASDGQLSLLSSLYLPSEIEVSMENEGIIIKIPLSLRTLSTTYKTFRVKFLFLSFSGSFDVNVDKNSLEVVLRLKAINPCTLNLDKVEVTSLEGIRVKFETSCRTCSSMLNTLTPSLANFLKGSIRQSVQKIIEDNIQKVIHKLPFTCANIVKT